MVRPDSILKAGSVLLTLATGTYGKPELAKRALPKVMYGQNPGSSGSSLDSAPLGEPLGVSKREDGFEIFKRACNSGYWQCLDGLCYPRTYGCCQSSWGHGCPPGEGCCGNGCWNENGSCCNWDRYYGCDPGWKCCEGKCIPDGTSCCKGGKYCQPSKPYCVLYRGEIGCCTTADCSEEFEDTRVTQYRWYYTTVYWTYYWYYYYYSIRTTYTTSTRTTTSTVVSVYATDSADANDELSSTARQLATETPVQTTTTFSGSTPESTPARTPTPTGGDDDFEIPDPEETSALPTSITGGDLFPTFTGGDSVPTGGNDDGNNNGASAADQIAVVGDLAILAIVGAVLGNAFLW